MQEDKFIVTGGKKLSGTVRLRGFKNNSIKLIPACAMIDGDVVLRDIPDLLDVQVALQIFRELGGIAEYDSVSNTCRLNGTGINSYEINPELTKKYRASLSFLGPLYTKFGKVSASFPGGDKIGVRDISTHFQAFEALGAKINEGKDGHFMIEKKAEYNKIMLEQPSVSATENAINAAVLNKGKIELFNVACEPHVVDLCTFLNQCGAKIAGVGSNLLTIEGVDALHGCEYTLCTDPVDAGTYIIAACMTQSSITIENVNVYNMQPILTSFKKLGVEVIVGDNKIVVPDKQSMKIHNKYWGGIYSQPWPMFPTDLMSPAIALATQCEGHILFFEKMYEGRMNFTSQLNSMAANIFMVDPHRVIVYGKTPLYGAQVSSLDVRAGVAVLLAALCAEGQTEILGIKHIDRGYDHIDQILNSLGAEIKRV